MFINICFQTYTQYSIRDNSIFAYYLHISEISYGLLGYAPPKCRETAL